MLIASTTGDWFDASKVDVFRRDEGFVGSTTNDQRWICFVVQDGRFVEVARIGREEMVEIIEQRALKWRTRI